MFGKTISTQLLRVAHSQGHSACEVVFIHGLDGDPIGSWRFDRAPSWHTWIAEAAPNANIWSLGYRLRSTRWFGGSMALTDRAINLLAVMSTELSGDSPIIFVCHSYGGLVAKQVVRSGSDVAIEYAEFTQRIAGIVFLATPHNGSSMADFVDVLGRVVRKSPAIGELRTNEPLLRDLSSWFQTYLSRKSIRTRSYFETLDTKGLRVVSEASANPNVGDHKPVAVDADHINICKPDTCDFRVKQTIKLIQTVASEGSTVAPKADQQSAIIKLLSAKDEEIPYLKAELEGRIAADPSDIDARRGLAHIGTILQSLTARHLIMKHAGSGLYRLSAVMLLGVSVSIITSLAGTAWLEKPGVLEPSLASTSPAPRSTSTVARRTQSIDELALYPDTGQRANEATPILSVDGQCSDSTFSSCAPVNPDDEDSLKWLTQTNYADRIPLEILGKEKTMGSTLSYRVADSRFDFLSSVLWRETKADSTTELWRPVNPEAGQAPKENDEIVIYSDRLKILLKWNVDGGKVAAKLTSDDTASADHSKQP